MLSRGARMLNPALTESRSKLSNSVFTREARASMSVNERASLETTMAFFPISFCADSRPAAQRPVTKTRAPIEEHLRRREPHAARAADNHHLFTLVPFHVYFLEMLGLLC